jgi:hypothetical protein
LSTQTVGDFSASILITADPNWQQKWKTPPDSDDEHDLPCFVTPLAMDPRLVYLNSIGVKFTAEAGDPKGTWTVAIPVRDMLRNVTIPLRYSFEMGRPQVPGRLWRAALPIAGA